MLSSWHCGQIVEGTIPAEATDSQEQDLLEVAFKDKWSPLAGFFGEVLAIPQVRLLH